MVTNFLNFAKPAQLMLSPVDLQSIAERAADEVRPDTQTRGGTVVVRGEFPVIEGDDVLLRQAFSNVLRNAVEACVDASTVPNIIVDGRVEGSTVRVTVDDNGPGIPAADRERVFRPFVTTKGRGAGLGLALVQSLVSTMASRLHLHRLARQVRSCPLPPR